MRFPPYFCSLFLLLGFVFSCSPNLTEETPDQYDLVVYGGTSAGIAAALQASRMNHSVVLIEPSGRLGGLTTGGLGQTDIGNKQAIGGIAREFYQGIGTYYENSENWEWQRREDYQDGGQTRTAEGEDAMWTFEPSAALDVYQKMLSNSQVVIVMNEFLDRENGVARAEGRIASITMESGKTFTGNMFIDATYEGDLMAAAGVDYIVGREANSTYGETYNGVQMREHHQFPDGVDPYVVPGDSTSGLLWGISENTLASRGSGDDLVQAYNFRICLTDNAENKVNIDRPPGYDSSRYELLVRLFSAQPDQLSVWDYFIWSSMPNAKTDINNRGGFSTDMINYSHAYPGASYEEREEIYRRHKEYTQGLLYFYQNDPRVPAPLREEVSRWGYPKDEYTGSGHWSPQLYVREARRMIGEYVMTQANCEGKEVVQDAVGLAAYTMDSHNCQRIVVDGQVKNEGDVQIGGFPPYPISFRSLLPQEDQATNLLVPVSLSASHIAFGSIRMEPVFMVLGQSAATAAMLALEQETTLHELPYHALRNRLLQDGQVLDHTVSPAAPE